MDKLKTVIEENNINHRYQVTRVDTNPREMEHDSRIRGAIWLDREAMLNDVLMEDVPGNNGRMIIILNHGIADGASFRFLYGDIGGAQCFFFEKGAIMRIVGSIHASASNGVGKIHNQ